MPHFQKYKQGTLSMVKELELVDVKPLIYRAQNEAYKEVGCEKR